MRIPEVFASIDPVTVTLITSSNPDTSVLKQHEARPSDRAFWVMVGSDARELLEKCGSLPEALGFPEDIKPEKGITVSLPDDPARSLSLVLASSDKGSEILFKTNAWDSWLRIGEDGTTDGLMANRPAIECIKVGTELAQIEHGYYTYFGA